MGTKGLLPYGISNREKEMHRYSKALYQAFYEGGQRPRFLPLVEKYGERPLEWGEE